MEKKISKRVYLDYTTRITTEYRDCIGSRMPELHMHTHYELLLIENGELTIESEREMLHCSAPAIVLFSPHEYHRLNAEMRHRYSRWLIYFTQDVAERVLECSGGEIALPRSFPGPMTALPLDEASFAPLRFCMQMLTVPECSVQEQYLLLALLLFRLRALLTGSHSLEAREAKPHGYIDDIMRYIAENDSPSFRISDIPERFFVSATKLRADFRAVAGITMKQYQQKLRIGRAKKMLDAGRPVTEIILECGFSSSSDFIRTFHRYTGTTPRAYMKIRHLRESNAKKGFPI